MSWCNLFFIQGVINGTHVSIMNPSRPFAKDQYFKKASGCSIIYLIVVDCNKCFIDYFFLCIVNDCRMMGRSTSYKHAIYIYIVCVCVCACDLFPHIKCISVNPLYIIGDEIYF